MLAAPAVTATYAYYANGRVQSITYNSGAAQRYAYDEADRLQSIDHRNLSGVTMLKLVYAYDERDLPISITEKNSAGVTTATVLFTYDLRGRLLHEVRTGTGPYDLAYTYDNGGNRQTKVNALANRKILYEYDIENPALYGTANNRLMKSEERVTSTNALVSTTWYSYNCSGNVTRVVTGFAGSTQYSATRMEYAKNEKAVSFVLGESWQWDGVAGNCPTAYALSYAREFRYDTGRARYLNRTLSTSALLQNPSVYTPTSSTWSEYDSDDAYGDFTVSGSTVTMGNLYEPGLWRKESGVSQYLHNDHLGTLRLTSNTSGQSDSTTRVFTAFGERIAGPSGLDRYGYVGEHGYQTDSTGAFPFLHLGARYYDPSSGRFLQRDPIGLRGGLSIYDYVHANPLLGIDPEGLWSWDSAGVGGIAGIIAGSKGGTGGIIAGAVAGIIGGGYQTGDAGRAWNWAKQGNNGYFQYQDADFGRNPNKKRYIIGACGHRY